MFTGIDHVVILVQRLDDAIRTYQGLGFNVYPGGEHPGGTHNALVIFRDGAYLELIAFQQPDRPHDHRWYRFLSTGGGIVDFAVGWTTSPRPSSGPGRLGSTTAARCRVRAAGWTASRSPGGSASRPKTSLARCRS